MQKTIKEWLQELPEPDRKLALKYGKISLGAFIYSDKADSLREALTCAFPWKDTPEGSEYWREVANGKHASLTDLPKNALEAIHAIALKEGFKAEDIIAINPGDEIGEWWYKISEEFISINLKNN